MTTPEVGCKSVAIQNNSQWPCSMRPIPSRLVGVRTSYIFFVLLLFPGHPEFWTPLQIPIWAPPQPWLCPVTVQYILKNKGKEPYGHFNKCRKTLNKI